MAKQQKQNIIQAPQIGFVSLFVDQAEQPSSPTLHLCSNGCWSTSCFQNG